MSRRVATNFSIPNDENVIGNPGRRPKQRETNVAAGGNGLKTKKRVALSEISSTISNASRLKTVEHSYTGKSFLSIKDDNKVQILGGQAANNRTANKFTVFNDFPKREKPAAFTIHVDGSTDDEFDENEKENHDIKDKSITEEIKVECDKLSLHPIVTGITLPNEPFKKSLNESYLEDSDSFCTLDTSYESAVEETRYSFSDQCFKDPDYINSVYFNMKQAENNHHINSFYMRKQPDITPVMRRILIDWIVEVAEEYELHPETLHLSIAYIDAFLSVMSVAKHKLQLVGTSCLFIASKYEEIYPRGVKEFVYITDDTYTDEQVLKMEHLILRVLSFNLTRPTKYMFVKWYCFRLQLNDREMENLALYICELSMLETEPFMKYLPSELALSSLILARNILQRPNFLTCDAEMDVGYTLDEINDCSSALTSVYVAAAAPDCQCQAVKEKYKLDKYCKVSQINPSKLGLPRIPS